MLSHVLGYVLIFMIVSFKTHSHVAGGNSCAANQKHLIDGLCQNTLVTNVANYFVTNVISDKIVGNMWK